MKNKWIVLLTATLLAAVVTRGRAETASGQPPPKAPSPAATASQNLLNSTLALLSAAEAGDTSNRTQLSDDVTAVSKDPNLTTHDRYLVAARAKGLAIKETRGLTRVTRMAAFEQEDLDLISTFPGETEPYESLVALANDEPDPAAGVKLAQQILSMTAPAAIKAEAQRLLDREAMVGKPVPAIIANRTGDSINLDQYRGRVLVIYAWSGAGKNSASWVQHMLLKGTQDVAFVGVNFDSDRLSALSKAADISMGLPQLLDQDGLGGQLAAQLNISRAPTIYLVDRTGVVVDVHGWSQFPTKLAKLLATKGGQP